ncbi:uncharacterized [Tachysurus ichikawai]
MPNLPEPSVHGLEADLLILAALAPRLGVTCVPSLSGFCIKNSVKQEARRPLSSSQVDGGRLRSKTM